MNPAAQHCRHKINKGIMRFDWCKRPAVKDGYCTRHQWTYETPKHKIAREAHELAHPVKPKTST